ncbi:DUF563 domain-containing protein [Asaia sp. As-1742]|uniref:glycosyltransferase family 61 protein n=1 Tax=Asaia sp. As-1742 TaxID=2608325 RepID=UPI0014205F4C|nr:glycosyltransferase 61 family protein [Asaia sp. As-1742]NIE80416.1 glycosyltransferase family 61 protein [Asaia sp. As-1742]
MLNLFRRHRVTPTSPDQTVTSPIVKLEGLSLWRAQADGYHEVIGPDSYQRPAPDMFNFVSDDTELKNYILRELSYEHMQTPPEDVYILRDAYVSDFPAVFMGDRTLFDPSMINISIMPEFGSLCPNSDNVPFIDDVAVFIFHGGKDNHGHRLVEMLAKLENIVCVLDGQARLLLPPLGERFERELAELLTLVYPGKFIICPMTAPMYRVRQLLYAGPIAQHSTRKSRTLSRFCNRLRAAVEQGRQRRLYVSRERSSTRVTLNESDVRQAFEGYGFETIFPEDMTIVQQCAVFSGATHVAGPLGAGLTNVAFCGEGSSLFMIDPGIYDFFFWDLCGLRQIKFSWHFAQAIRRMTVERSHEAYSVPIGSLRQSLEISYS